MHVDDCANHLLLAWVMRDRQVVGGEFVLPDYGIYWPLRDNQLFWFANSVWHGTAVTEPGESREGQMTLASSIPMPLWRRLSTRDRPTPEAGRSELPSGSDDVLIAQSKLTGDDDVDPRGTDFLDEFSRLSTTL